MCGIFGALGPAGEIPAQENLSKSSEGVLRHRGPDDYGSFEASYAGSDVYLDHNRLSIIGLGPQGHQPFLSEDKSTALTYNGEIYNYESLKEKLAQQHGCTFETTTDTEVLLKAYEKWGLDKTLREIVGIFAFGIVNLSTGIAHVVRDHLGVKPVYYAAGDSLLFASEVKALLEKGNRDARLNYGALGEYLANFWVYEPDTLFEGIYKLESGHYIEYNLKSNSIDKVQYWDIIDNGDNKRPDKIDEDIEAVVREQLVSDVPLGMYLSGGVDSSILAYHATQDQPLKALNLRNDTPSESGEYNNIKRLTDQLDFEVESIAPDGSMLEIYREMVYHMDEPIADPAIIPANLLARAARERGTKVMLSGMGGDEIFGGYRRMHVVANISWLKYFSPIFSLMDQLLPEFASRMRRNLKRIANFLCDPDPSNYFSISYYFSREEINNLTGDEGWYQRYDKKISNLIDGKEFIDDAQRYQYLDIRGYLASHNLLYMDKASMADAIEVRVPLLDHRFAARYFNIPTEEKLAEGLKTPLKEHLADVVGEEFTGHRKQGFSFPIAEYLREDLTSELNRMLKDDRFAKVVNIEVAEQLVEDHRDERADNAMKLWALYTLWLWLRTFDVQVE